jgi:acetylornithine aminotransferase
MLAKAKLAEAFGPGSHASTFGGTPIAMAAVKATIETMLAGNVPQRAAESGEYLKARLEEKLAGCPAVQEVRGLGLIVGIVCDRPIADLVAEIHRRGLLVVTAGPNVIRLLPNLLVTREEIDQAVDILAGVLTGQAAAAQS